MKRQGLLTVLAAALLAGASFGANSFRVTPYVQHPKPNESSLEISAPTKPRGF